MDSQCNSVLLNVLNMNFKEEGVRGAGKKSHDNRLVGAILIYNIASFESETIFLLVLRQLLNTKCLLFMFLSGYFCEMVPINCVNFHLNVWSELDLILLFLQHEPKVNTHSLMVAITLKSKTSPSFIGFGLVLCKGK